VTVLSRARLQSPDKLVFTNAADIVNTFEDDELDGDDEIKSKRVKAESIIRSLDMDVDAVVEIISMRLDRNGSRHFIDRKQHSDKVVVHNRIQELQKELADWGVQTGRCNEAERILSWSFKLLQHV
jgi:hypothetical protein